MLTYTSSRFKAPDEYTSSIHSPFSSCWENVFLFFFFGLMFGPPHESIVIFGTLPFYARHIVYNQLVKVCDLGAAAQSSVPVRATGTIWTSEPKQWQWKLQRALGWRCWLSVGSAALPTFSHYRESFHQKYLLMELWRYLYVHFEGKGEEWVSSSVTTTEMSEKHLSNVKNNQF